LPSSAARSTTITARSNKITARSAPPTAWTTASGCARAQTPHSRLGSPPLATTRDVACRGVARASILEECSSWRGRRTVHAVSQRDACLRRSMLACVSFISSREARGEGPHKTSVGSRRRRRGHQGRGRRGGRGGRRGVFVRADLEPRDHVALHLLPRMDAQPSSAIPHPTRPSARKSASPSSSTM